MLLSLPLLVLAFTAQALSSSLPLRTLWEFPNGTWVENLAVRSNGNLLVTLVNTPELWEIDPYPSGNEIPAKLIHRFEGAEMANGISELTEDVFAVIASNTVYKVAFNARNNSAPVSVSEVVNVTAAGVLNGMATLDASNGVVLISDSRRGVVWRLETRNGTYEIVLQDESMTARTGRRSLIGINGIKTVDGYVYYNNCPGRLYCRVEINVDTGTAVGPYETIATGSLADDIAVTPGGVAYLAGLDDNVITRITLNGTQEVIAGNLNSSALVGPTAAAFGRTSMDNNTLYIVTSGGTAAPLNGTYTEGGRVMALSL